MSWEATTKARPRSRTILLAAGLALLCAASRLPLLAAGYGSDDDAWLVARSADLLSGEGRYRPSRLPGYPTAEAGFAVAFRLFGTSFITGNTTALLAGLGGVLLLVVAARRLAAPHPLLAGAVLAFHPAFWVASASTLDFVWSTALVVAALERLLARRPLAAGVLLGLAAGARLTTVLLVVPWTAFLAWRGRRWRASLHLAAAAAVTVAVAYLPVLLLHGPRFAVFDAPVRRDYLTGGYRALDCLVGVPALLVLAAILAVTLATRDRSPFNRAPDGDDALLLASYAVLTVPWLLLPSDPFYLLPAVPPALLLVLRRLRAAPALAAAVALALPSFVGLARLDVTAYRERGQFRVMPVSRGQVGEDLTRRRRTLAVASALRGAVVPPGSCLVAGPAHWALQLDQGVPERDLAERFTRAADDVLFVRILRAEWLDEVAGRRPVYYVGGEDLPYLTRRIFGYSLDDLGARELAPAVGPASADLSAPAR